MLDLQDRIARILEIPPDLLVMFHSAYLLNEDSAVEVPIRRLEGELRRDFLRFRVTITFVAAKSIRVSLRGAQTAQLAALLQLDAPKPALPSMFG